MFWIRRHKFYLGYRDINFVWNTEIYIFIWGKEIWIMFGIRRYVFLLGIQRYVREIYIKFSIFNFGVIKSPSRWVYRSFTKANYAPRSLNMDVEIFVQKNIYLTIYQSWARLWNHVLRLRLWDNQILPSTNIRHYFLS